MPRPHQLQPRLEAGRCVQAPAASKEAVGAQQLDRRSLLLGVLVGGQLLSLPQVQPASADGNIGITTVRPTQQSALTAACAPALHPSAASRAQPHVLPVQVFVAGSTGRTGRRVVQQLRAAGYKVRAGVRVSGRVWVQAPPQQKTVHYVVLPALP
jgi:hypothetical protein